MSTASSVPERVDVITVTGDLDVATVEAFTDRVRAALRGGLDVLVIDVGEVEFLDSSGIGALVAARNRALEREIDLVLRRPRPRVARILEITGMDQVFRVDGSTPDTP